MCIHALAAQNSLSVSRKFSIIPFARSGRGEGSMLKRRGPPPSFPRNKHNLCAHGTDKRNKILENLMHIQYRGANSIAGAEDSGLVHRMRNESLSTEV